MFEQRIKVFSSCSTWVKKRTRGHLFTSSQPDEVNHTQNLFLHFQRKISLSVLKSKIIRLFGASDGEKFNVNVLSFGFKFGLPMDADLVLDVRFLPNPFYEEELKHKSGMVPEVGAYIEKSRVTKSFEKKLDDMLAFLIPQYIKEGKSQLVIAVGCTGGLHRSVFIAKHIFELMTKLGHQATLEHRDLMKNDVREHMPQEV